MSKYDVKETIVIEIKEDYVIVMDPSGEIHRLKRKDSLAVGDKFFTLILIDIKRKKKFVM